jgi:NitT/TauT family transport system permease protein
VAAPPPLLRRPRRRRPDGLRIGGHLGAAPFALISLAVFGVLLVVWWLVTSQGLVSALVLPSPHAVWHRMRQLQESGDLFSDMGISIYRIAVAFAIATAMAVPLGVLMGTFAVWEAALEPLVDFVRYMPVVGFIPLTIFWVGFDDTQKFLIIWIGTFFQEVLLIMDNVKRTPPSLVDLGRTLGLSERAILVRIVVPYAAPGIWDSLRISLGWAWTWVVLAELSGASSGLGFRINEAQRFFESDTVIGYLLLLGLLGLVTDQGMKALSRLFFGWSKARAS